MVTRRDVIFGIPATLGAVSFAPAALADDSRSVRTNLATEMVRHTDWFMYKSQSVTPESLQDKVSVESWNSDDIAAEMAKSWDHLRESEAAQQIIDDYQNNDGKRFYDAFVKTRGITEQSVPTYIDFMFNRNATRAFRNINAKSEYDSIYDTPFKAVILNSRDGAISEEDFVAARDYVASVWQEGFEKFRDQTLIPELENGPATPEPQGPKPLNFGNGG